MEDPEFTEYEDDLMCYCCMRPAEEGTLKHRASSLSPMLLPYCEDCLSANADPEWTISSVLSEHDGDPRRAGDLFSAKVLYWKGAYITVGEFCARGEYRRRQEEYTALG